MSLSWDVIDQPIIWEDASGPTTLTDILARIASIRGRASDWGVTDQTRAELLTGSSLEADFRSSYYRDGFVESSSPLFLPGWTFSRTGAGTAETQGRTLTDFATDVARITDRGLLMEDAATKLLLHSETIGDGTNWPFSGAASASLNAALAPDGTMTATVLTLPAAGAGTYTFVTTEAGQPYAGSMFIRSATPGQIGLVSVQTTTGSTAVDVTTEWQQFDFSVVAGSTSDGPWLRRMDSGQLAEVEVWGAGFELGKPTSYVKTTTATVTRGADSASLSRAGAPEFTLYGEVEMGPTVGGLVQPLVFWSSGSAVNRVGVYRYNSSLFVTRLAGGIGGDFSISAADKGGARVVRLALVYDGLWHFTVDGAEVFTGEAGALPQGLTTIRPGWSESFDRRAGGYVRKVLAIPHALTAAERLAITGG